LVEEKQILPSSFNIEVKFEKSINKHFFPFVVQRLKMASFPNQAKKKIKDHLCGLFGKLETADSTNEKARDSSNLYKLISFYSFRDCFYGK
jgi:hypothetical protein